MDDAGGAGVRTVCEASRAAAGCERGPTRDAASDPTPAPNRPPDEPTNFVDIDCLLWLQEALRRYPHTLVVVSHDRAFLDTVCTDIVYLNHHTKKLQYYTGNFSTFQATRAEKAAKQQRLQAALDKKRDHVIEQIEQMQQRATAANRSGKSDKYRGQTGLISSRKTKTIHMGLDKVRGAAGGGGGERAGSRNVTELTIAAACGCPCATVRLADGERQEVRGPGWWTALVSSRLTSAPLHTP